MITTRVQGEAFALMWYATKDGARERIWNSRDAVTPFVISSRDGKEMNHVDWSRDEFAPYHVPKVGDRVFVDLTPDLAAPAAKAYVARHWDAADYPMSAAFEGQTKEEVEIYFVREWVADWGGHSPHLIEVDETYRRLFEAQAKARREADTRGRSDLGDQLRAIEPNRVGGRFA